MTTKKCSNSDNNKTKKFNYERKKLKKKGKGILPLGHSLVKTSD